MKRQFLLIALFLLLIIVPTATSANNVYTRESTIKVVAPPDYFDADQHGIQILQEYGTFTLYAITSAYASQHTLTADSHVRILNDDNLLQFSTAPIQTDRISNPNTTSAAWELSGPALSLVQFVGPIKEEWLQAIEQTGAEPVHYVANYGYLIWADEPTRTQINELVKEGDFLQYSAAYQTPYKYGPAALALIDRGTPSTAKPVTVVIQMINHADKSESEAFIKELSLLELSGWTSVLNFQNAIVTVQSSDLPLIASRPDVFWVEEFIAPELLDEVQSQILAGNLNATQTAPGGPGYLAWLESLGFPDAPERYPIIDIMDDGIGDGTLNSGDATLRQSGQLNNKSRIAYLKNCTTESDAGGIGGHGHINASIAAGYDDRSGSPFVDGNGYHRGLGLNPFGRLGGTRIFNNDAYFDISNCGYDLVQLIADSYANGTRISSNSWGCAICGSIYDITSQLYDAATRDALPAAQGNQELVFVVGAGNSGPSADTILTPGNAKNVITVGGSENVRPEWTDGCLTFRSDADNAMDMASFSSRGPTPGNRVKPEVVAPATHVQGTASTHPAYVGNLVCDKYYPAGQTIFAASSGTSHATPAVSGIASLYYYWLQNTYGIATPSPAMIKAYLIAHPTYLTGDGAGDSLPSNSQGYGMPNLALAFDDADRFLLDQSLMFEESGAVWQLNTSAADPTKPVRIVLAYTDQPGAVGIAPQVNDLNLQVEFNGKTYWGNRFSGQWSVSGGAPDSANNYEAIYLPPGTTGNLTIAVSAFNIAGDGIPNVGDKTDQDFALVCYNCANVPDFQIEVEPQQQTVCLNQDSVNYAVHVSAASGFNDAVSLAIAGLPNGAVANFQPDNVSPVGDSSLLIEQLSTQSPGLYRFVVSGTAGAAASDNIAWLELTADVPGDPASVTPIDAAENIPVNPEFHWEAVENADFYHLQISTTPAFSEIVYEATVTENSHKMVDRYIRLDTDTIYYWRIRTGNACGESISDVYEFTTASKLPVLLVDDDWGGRMGLLAAGENEESRYFGILSQSGVYFDLWNVELFGGEPDAQTLSQYDLVIWFSGDASCLLSFLCFTPYAGPDAHSEQLLANYLDEGHCLLLSSKDYLFDRGITSFMRSYLGVADGQDDVGYTSITGVGELFGELGSFAIDGAAVNGRADPDIILPDSSALLAFMSENGEAGIYKVGDSYLAVYLGFGLEDVDHIAQLLILETFMDACYQSVITPAFQENGLFLPLVVAEPSRP